MKRRDLLRQLAAAGCYLARHDPNHDIYASMKNGRKPPVPRHPEIKESLCALIKKQLGIGI